MSLRPMSCCGNSKCLLRLPEFIYAKVPNGFGMGGTTDSRFFFRPTVTIPIGSDGWYGPGADVPPFEARLNAGGWLEFDGDIRVEMNAQEWDGDTVDPSEQNSTTWAVQQSAPISSLPLELSLPRTSGTLGDSTLQATLFEFEDVSIYTPLFFPAGASNDRFFDQGQGRVDWHPPGTTNFDTYPLLLQMAICEMGEITVANGKYPTIVAALSEQPQQVIRLNGDNDDTICSLIGNPYNNCSTGEDVTGPKMEMVPVVGAFPFECDIAVTWAGNRWERDNVPQPITLPITFTSADKVTTGTDLQLDDITFREGSIVQSPYNESVP